MKKGNLNVDFVPKYSKSSHSLGFTSIYTTLKDLFDAMHVQFPFEQRAIYKSINDPLVITTRLT
jgi:hypothetical protein